MHNPYPNPDPSACPNYTLTHALILTPNFTPLNFFYIAWNSGGGVKSRSLMSKSGFLTLLFNTENQGDKKSVGGGLDKKSQNMTVIGHMRS